MILSDFSWSSRFDFSFIFRHESFSVYRFAAAWIYFCLCCAAFYYSFCFACLCFFLAFWRQASVHSSRRILAPSRPHHQTVNRVYQHFGQVPGQHRTLPDIGTHCASLSHRKLAGRLLCQTVSSHQSRIRAALLRDEATYGEGHLRILARSHSLLLKAHRKFLTPQHNRTHGVCLVLLYREFHLVYPPASRYHQNIVTVQLLRQIAQGRNFLTTGFLRSRTRQSRDFTIRSDVATPNNIFCKALTGPRKI